MTALSGMQFCNLECYLCCALQSLFFCRLLNIHCKEFQCNFAMDRTRTSKSREIFRNLKGAVSAFRGVSQISKSSVWIDLLLDKDYSDQHKNAKNAILAEL